MKKIDTKLGWLIIIFLSLNFNSFSQLTLQDSLKAYYPFNGNANDESGNGNDGTVIGATLTTDRFGNTNSAYDFDGTAGYIDVPNAPELKPSFPFSISLWAKFDSLDPVLSVVLYHSDESTVGYAGYYISCTPAGQIFAMYGDETGFGITNRKAKFSNTIVDSTNWFYIAGVFNGLNDIDLYINSQLDSGYYTGSGGSIVYSSFNGIIGKYVYLGDTTYHNGKIDDIRIYNRALSAAEIDSIYNEQPVSIKDLNKEESCINIYPNPTSDKFEVTINNNELPTTDYKLKVYNMLGELVYQSFVNNHSTIINLQSQKGIYFLKVYTRESMITRKIVIH